MPLDPLQERIAQVALARAWKGCIDYDHSGQILTAWIAKMEL
jgi:hypothetical protein